MRDDKRNSLVRRSAQFAVALAADIVVMENARELVRGNFKHHLISYQLAHLSCCTLTGEQPAVPDILLPKTNVKGSDIVKKGQLRLFHD